MTRLGSLRVVFSGGANLTPTSYFKKNMYNIQKLYTIVKQSI